MLVFLLLSLDNIIGTPRDYVNLSYVSGLVSIETPRVNKEHSSLSASMGRFLVYNLNG